MGAVRKRYGDGPLHLIAILASLAIVAYAFLEIAQRPGPVSFAIFFAGAIVAHDLIAFPIYSALDRLAGGVASRARLGPATINYVRVPALLSVFAFIVWFPLILALDPGAYESAAGRAPPDYFARWLALTAALFLGSGGVYAVRRRRSRPARGRATDRPGPRNRR
jgi:hypothetical protein